MPTKRIRADLPDYARTSRLLSIEETCALLGNMGRTTFWRFRKKHKLPVYHVGGVKYRYDEVMWLLDKIKE